MKVRIEEHYYDGRSTLFRRMLIGGEDRIEGDCKFYRRFSFGVWRRYFVVQIAIA